jgi:hypothetical protein
MKFTDLKFIVQVLSAVVNLGIAVLASHNHLFWQLLNTCMIFLVWACCYTVHRGGSMSQRRPVHLMAATKERAETEMGPQSGD